jgi:hypothetical protein
MDICSWARLNSRGAGAQAAPRGSPELTARHAYAGVLGVQLGRRPPMTQDADFAQFWGIAENIGGSTEPLWSAKIQRWPLNGLGTAGMA